MVAFTSFTLCTMLSVWGSRVGNLPALLKPGPSSLGICLIRLSDARKASYFLARYKIANTSPSISAQYFNNNVQHTNSLLSYTSNNANSKPSI